MQVQIGNKMESEDKTIEMKETISKELEDCLKPTSFIDYDTSTIMEYAKRVVAGAKNEIEKGVRLYYAVRDEIRYDPYGIELTPEGFKASVVLQKQRGYCVAKAVLLAALARSVSIPSRIGLADVRNHLTTERLKSMMKTDLFRCHGFTELWLDGRWVKATPTFNLSLCERFGIKPLDFDGRNDALFHEFDGQGNRHMEYIRYYGSFIDLPYDIIVDSFTKYYPEFFNDVGSLITGDFEQEAAKEHKSA